VITFAESHCVGHDCWHLHDPNHPQHDCGLTELIGDPVVNIYEALDAALGRLLAKVDDDVTVFLVLSHGMGPDYEANSTLDEILWRIEKARRGGYALARTRTLFRRARFSVEWRARTRLGLPHGNGRGTVDRRRRFFAVPNYDACGAICINLAGREPDGRVMPGQDYEDVVGMLEDELGQLLNLETGEPLVRGVFRTAERYDGPAASRMPDLYVEWNRNAPIRSIGSPTIGRVGGSRPSYRTGDHREGGLLVCAGPSIAARQVIGPVESVRIAPAICEILGCALPGSESLPWFGAHGAPA
jgi:predicted AlkP superfamily phosphohydrolase/phosphomutase